MEGNPLRWSDKEGLKKYTDYYNNGTELPTLSGKADHNSDALTGKPSGSATPNSPLDFDCLAKGTSLESCVRCCAKKAGSKGIFRAFSCGDVGGPFNFSACNADCHSNCAETGACKGNLSD